MDMDRYIGRLLDGRYEILEVIGTGGMAVVYKARCHRLNRLVAVKILKDELTQDDEFRRRFHAESQAVAALSHPNIVSVYDVSTSDDADYIVMELIDGISLKQYMGKKGVLNWKETLHFAIQIAKALDHAHSRGIIHRDIKPHNVMVLKNGSVKVADFGIAQVMSKSNTLTKEALGSVHYISPEQAKGGRVDNRSDLYSLGVVMYEMMTGRPPFDGESPVAVAIQHINGNAVMPSTLNPNIPGGLEQIIVKAMAKDPAERYATATAMLYDMDEFRKDPTILFDYNNASTGLDDATHMVTPAVEATAPTVAEKAAVRAGGDAPVRRDPAPRKPAAPAKKKRRREEIVEDEDRGGKIATIVIIVCTLIALVAIGGIMISVLGNQNPVTSNQNTISLPNLVGTPLTEAMNSTDYVVIVNHRSYNDQYPEGTIIHQSPAAKTRIEKGGQVSVIVSAGPENAEKLMSNLIDVDEATAVNYLVNVQGINKNLILKRYETSSTVAAGKVIRTDPIEGEPLVPGEPISIWISSGPNVKTVTMVDLTSDFYNETSARNWLDMNGFTNYEIQHIESTKPAGKVVSQSVKAGQIISVNTYIVLVVSGVQELPTEPTEPTAPPVEVPDPEDYVSKVVTVELPEDIAQDYVLTIYRDGVMKEERFIPMGTLFTQFELTGKDIMIFEIRLSTGASWKLQVDFAPGGAVTVVPDTPVFPDDPLNPDDPANPEDPQDPVTPTVPGQVTP